MIEILAGPPLRHGQIEAVAHLDNTRVLPDGSPDPAWVLRNSWQVSEETWNGWTPAQRDAWITSMQQEFAEMCRDPARDHR